MTDLVQIIRPWVVVDVTPPPGSQSVKENVTAPTNLAIGKNVAPHNVTNTTGSYAYDIMYYMDAVANAKEPNPTGGKQQGQRIGKGGAAKGSSGSGGSGGSKDSGSGSGEVIARGDIVPPSGNSGSGKMTDEDTNVPP